MEPVFILQLLVVVGLCSSLGHGATLDACIMVLLSEEFHTTCSTLGADHTRPCLVQSDKDMVTLKRAKVIGLRMSVPWNKICAARTETGEADCVSVHLTCSSQQNWQWTEWTGTSPNIARRFTVTEGSTDRLCPYEERYFVPEVFSDCLGALEHGVTTSGVYTISPDGSTELEVYCNMDLDGGGWTVFQKRHNGQLDFYRTWAEYKAGFGEVAGEFWLGLDDLHLLTKNNDQKVKFHLGLPDGQRSYAEYSEFWIGDETQNYNLHIGSYTGTAGDSMTYHNGMVFSTKDWGRTSCAVTYKGAWWYNGCHFANLNGQYGNTEFGQGLSWQTWKGHTVSLSYTAIMVKTKGA